MELILVSALNLLVVLGPGEPARSISFRVRHAHRLGHCDGVLRMDAVRVEYDTPHRKHAHAWSFDDLRHVELLSKRLVIRSYGKPERFKFRLREGELTEEAYRLLAERVGRGVTSRVLFPATRFLYELPVKHRHRFGGCEGMLRIASAAILYETENAEDRRLWRVGDIRSFGTAGPYDLRLTTEKETFNFDLKQALRQEVYDHLWQMVHKP